MTELRVLSAGQVDELLEPKRLEQALREALVALSAGRTDVPPRSGTEADGGLLLAMPGFVDGMGLATKLITLYPGNAAPEIGLPTHQGLIVLLDHQTGTPLAVMDAEVISAVRTAVTARIAAGILARDDSRTLTIVGGGAQALAHAEAFADLRAWGEVLAVNRSQPAAVRVAAAAREAGASSARAIEAEAETETGAPVGPEVSEAIAAADVLALCTHADHQVIDDALVRPGTHVSSVGSRAELPPGLIGRGPLVVEWRGAITSRPPAGAAELQGIDPKTAVELGELLVDDSKGRLNEDQVTIYKSTGHAVEDVAAASLVYQAAVDRGVGSLVDL